MTATSPADRRAPTAAPDAQTGHGPDHISIDVQEPIMLAKTPGHTNDRPVRAGVAVVLAGGLLIVTAFQAALTFGAPLGAAALGGTNSGQLPDAVRLVTGFSAALWLFAALLVLARGGYALVPVPEAVSRVGTWVLVGILGLGALMNFASSSPWERFGWGPFTLVLLVLGVVLVRSGVSPRPPAA
jgi:hypothetical protein